MCWISCRLVYADAINGIKTSLNGKLLPFEVVAKV